MGGGPGFWWSFWPLYLPFFIGFLRKNFRKFSKNGVFGPENFSKNCQNFEKFSENFENFNVFPLQNGVKLNDFRSFRQNFPKKFTIYHFGRKKFSAKIFRKFEKFLKTCFLKIELLGLCGQLNLKFSKDFLREMCSSITNFCGVLGKF